MKRIVIVLLFLHFTVTSFSSTITVKGLNYEIDRITYIAKVMLTLCSCVNFLAEKE